MSHSRPIKHPDPDMPASEEALADAFGEYWGGDFRSVGVDEHTDARAVFARLLNDVHDSTLDGELARLGLASRWFETSTGTVRLIHEQQDQKFGRGVFAFRDCKSFAVLQAPHTRNDPWTGKITGKWMAHQRFRAAAWNTVSRHSGNNADLARATRSYFVALADAAIDVLSQPNVIQLHGFNNDRRSTEAGRLSNVIASSGTEHPSRFTQTVVRRLSRNIDEVRLYPFNVLELGATGNPVGKRMRQREAGTFTHLELARPLRDGLRKSRKLTLWVGGCLLTTTDQ